MHLTRPPAVSRRPRRHRTVARVLAGVSLVPEEVELVFLRRLRGDARVGVASPVEQLQRRRRPIRLVVLAPDAGVRVVPDAVLLPAPRVLLPGARNREEPQAVLLDRAAERGGRVVVADKWVTVADFGMLAVVLRKPRTAEQVATAQLAARVVIALRIGDEVVARERVAAGAWNDVNRRAAGFRLAQPAGDLNADLLGVGHVGNIAAGHAHDAGAPASVDDRSVHHDAALRAAVGVVAGGVRAQVVDVVVAPDPDTADAAGAKAGVRQARRHRQHAADVARRRELANLRARKRRDLARTLHVDNWRLATDRDGLGQLADGHRGIDRSGESCGEHDVVTLLLREPRKGERHGIGADWQVGDSILS